MSEQPTAAARPPRAPGKTYAGLTRNQWLIVGGVFIAAVGYILWKRHESSKSSASSSTATATSTSTATSEELAGLQDEIDQLLAQQYSTATATGTSGGGTTGTTGSTGTSTSTSGTSTKTSTGTSTKTSTTTATSTSTAPAKKTAGAISNLVVTATGKTTAKATWNKASNATGGYAYKVTQMNGKVVKTGNTAATSVSISGLTAGWTYNFGIQALPGGPGNNEHFTTKS